MRGVEGGQDSTGRMKKLRYSTVMGRTNSMARGKSQIASGCLKTCFQLSSN
jgi:hypothetical protein